MKPIVSIGAALGLLALAPPPRLGEPLPGRSGDPSQAFAALEVVEHDQRKVLVDGAGVVRRVFAHGAAVDDEVLQYRQGRALWRDVCARCHGEDGQDTRYPGTPSLRGYGNGRETSEIRQKIEQSSTVNISHYKPKERQALAVFVGGL